MNLADPQVLRSFLARHGLSARKGLGQHFLCSAPVVDQIVGCLEGYRSAFEIGPGPGVLTSALASSLDNVLALEIDESLSGALAESAPSARVVFSDALKTDLPGLLSQLPEPRGLVSNLPYYITGPLLNRIASARECYGKAVLMMQKEVAERIVAKPGDGARGSISVYLQALFGIRSVAVVPASAFVPPPKVDSMVLEFVPVAGAADSEEFFDFVREGFSQPRKTLANNLARFGKAEVLVALEAEGLSKSQRPHELSLEQWRVLFLRAKGNPSTSSHSAGSGFWTGPSEGKG